MPFTAMAVFDSATVLSCRFLKDRVQTTWTNEGGGEGVAQVTAILNNSYLVKLPKIMSMWFVHAP